ncbi:peptidylprolyl isomerase [Membranicola marinus]|uniref:Periplasmic chaperone PpiD n=1 Tax=Membranihabitans marinus TaxID=1227546 RepID=A0A953LA29_9BACT|nr:peptidylprolyl isomerase [Membranihabitans marinus]MBY5959475.1 peptidylprolyl isomerase [Membranihabitans marinus]
MALIGTIRKNSWLLFVMIGVALAAFLVMDMVGQSSQMSMGNMSIGEVNGQEVDYREFMAHEEAVYAGGGSDMYSRRNFLWNYYLNKSLFDAEAEANGISVGKEELLALEFGSNLSPVIQQRFVNPQTGAVDYQQLNNIRQQIQSGTMPPETRQFWSWQEKEIITDRKQAKVQNLVAKAFYTPSWMVNRLMSDQNTTANIAFVKIPFNKAESADIQVSDQQIKDYMKNHKAEFYQEEETKTLEYMVIDVEPTSKDSANVEKRVQELKKEFAATPNDTTFIQSHEGSFQTAYQFRESVPAVIADSVFSKPVGSIVGPYPENGRLSVSKIINRKVIPDSVKARHILLTAQNQQQMIEGFQKADSLKSIIESGEISFDSLARAHSQGPSAPQGGQLGYAAQGQMVKPFNDLIFYEAEEGELYTIATQFGVHLVEVEDRKYINNKEGVQLATISENYVPSQETQDSLYNLAQSFLSSARTLEDLAQEISDKPEFRLQKAEPVTENAFMFANFGGGSVSRDIIRWAFENNTSDGDLSSVVYIYQNPQLFYNDRYVIVGLDQTHPKGYPDVETVRLNVEQVVMDQLKGQQIAESINQSDLKSIANEYGVQVDTAFGVSFFNDVVEGVGEEPALVAAVKNTQNDNLTPAVVGNTGVFVARPFSRQEVSTADYTSVRQNSVSQMAQQVTGALISSLKKNAEITDNRSEFY